jgi:hypothetical protein
MKVCRRRSAVDTVDVAAAAIADVAAGREAALVVADSWLVGDGAAIRKGGRLVVWQTPSFPRH